MNKAFIFPGQGSQNIGMGKDFYNTFPVAKETFQQVDETLKFNLSNVIFNGPEEELTLTTNTQPALMAVSSAIFNVLREQTGKKINNLCDIVAGHSLGEYSALYATSSLSLEDTTRLLQIRGVSMQEACPQGIGAMAACLEIEIDNLQSIIKDSITHGVCQIANDNITGQIVISGHVENIDMVVAIVKDLGFKATKLKVSAPFHCELMKPAEIKMARALEKVNINTSLVPILTNITAEKTIDSNIIKTNLIFQVCGRVCWRETLEQFAKIGITEIVEIGSGKVLTGMIKKTSHNFKTFNISNITEFEEYMQLNG